MEMMERLYESEPMEERKNRILKNYDIIFKEINEKSVKYISFKVCENEDWFRLFIKTNNSFNSYLVFGYDLIQLCNLIGIEFDIDKIIDGYKFNLKFV